MTRVAVSAAPTVAAVIRRVQAWVRSQPRQKRAICARAGVAPNTIGRIEAPDWRPSLTTLIALEALIPPDWREPVHSPGSCDEDSQSDAQPDGA